MSTKKSVEKKPVKNYVTLDYEGDYFSEINGPFTYEQALADASDGASDGTRSFIAKIEAEVIPERDEASLIGVPRLSKKQLEKKG